MPVPAYLNPVPGTGTPRPAQMVLLCGHTVPGRAWACLFQFQISAGRACAVPRAWVSQEQARPRHAQVDHWPGGGGDAGSPIPRLRHGEPERGLVGQQNNQELEISILL